MLQNYFTTALRNLLKHKGYTVLNVAGLAVGIAVCALILLWVRDELSYDRFHEHADRTYRVLWDARYGNNEWTLAKTPIPVADALREQIPEVEHATRFTPAPLTLRLGQDWVNEEQVLRAEPGFFDVFTVPFVAGDPTTALDDPNAVVLTEETARRYFSGQDPVGQSLEINDGRVLRVTGVVRRFPSQSHVQFDFLIPLDLAGFPEWRRTSWGTPPVYTYFVVREGVEGADVKAKLQDFVERTVLTDESYAQGENRYALPLQRLTDIHLRSRPELDLELSPRGNILYVYLFSLIGAFILILACINFVNLATARGAGRAKEVGVRKVLGSHRAQLVGQFLAESFLYVILAWIVAVLLISLALPAFNLFSGKHLEMADFGAPIPLLMIAGITAAVTLLAGAYPAFFLSAFWPVDALKGARGLHLRRDRLRDLLVVAQFCISIALIIGTLVVRDQLAYVQSRQLGFDREHVLVVESADALGARQTLFRERLEAHPLVAGTSAAQSLPGRLFDSTLFEPEQPAGYAQSSVNYAGVDEGFADVLGLRIVAGRNFAPSRHPADSSAFLINRAAADALGWDDPVGRTLRMGGSDPGPVIGVVEDFHYESLHTEIEPVFFPFARWTPPYVAVRLRPGRIDEGVAAVQEIWNELVPQRPFDYSFLDRDYAALYSSEQKVARVFGAFALLGLFIACLGLFGLASYAAVQRTKEIGIRKVFGASVGRIVALLSADSLKLVGVAFILAAPPAYVAMQRWLEGFAYRVGIGPGVFLLAGGLVLVVALLAVTVQSARAALADPVESLRYE